MPPYKKRIYSKKTAKKSFVKTNRTKKLVTGRGPTMLETISSGVGSVATLARAVMPAIMAINTEAKYHDVATSVTPTFSTPHIANLSLFGQGLTDKDRVGNSLLAKNLQWKITIKNPETAFSTKVRFMLISDKSQGGVPPTLAQIMELPSSTLSMSNKNFSDRFVIMKDELIDLNQQDMAAGVLHTDKGFKQLDFHIRYLGPGNTAPNAGPNSLYLLIWPDIQVSCSYYTRLNFTDN